MTARGREQGGDRRVWPAVCLLALPLALGPAGATLAPAQAPPRYPVAEVLGRPIHETDLVSPQADAEQKAKLSAAEHQTWHQRTREEALRRLVWSAVVGDFVQKRKIEATPAEVESEIRAQAKFLREDQVRREQQRTELVAELASPGVTATRRQQAQAQLETLNSLRDHDRRMERERSDPERDRMFLEAERRVAETWVKQWKVNQALYREFGGRIVFQQAGWEPIDAYRALLDRYRANRGFVVHDPSLQDAVYRYFRHNFVYADPARAKFYFERPYWERAPEEMKAAGF